MWTDRIFTTVENQRKFILPYNDISKTIFYNQRLIISPPLETPIAWKISKVEGMNPLGVLRFTCAQDVYNPDTDVIEYDKDGKWEAWADLKKQGNTPQKPPVDPIITEDYAEITYNGASPIIKIGGSYRKISIAYYNSKELISNQTPGDWSFWIGDEDVTQLVNILQTDNENSIKIKFLGDEEYLDKLLTIRNTRDNIVAEYNLEIVSL